MSIESILIILLIGAVAGWLAGLLFRGYGFGLVGNIIVGIVGGFIGTWILGELGVVMPGGEWVSPILTALVGASVLLLVIGLVRGKDRRRF